MCVYTTLWNNSLDKIPFLLFHCRGVLENEVTNSTIDFEEINDATFCRSLSFATSLCQAILPNISLTGFKRWLTLMAAPFIGRVALGAVQIFLVIKLGTDPSSYPSLKLYRRPLVWKLFLSVVLSVFWVLHLSSGIVESTFNCSFTKLATFESGGSAFIKHFPLNRTTCHSQKNTSPPLSQLLLFFIIKYAQL